MDNDYRINYYLGRANKKFYIKIPHSKKFCSGREFNATFKNLSDRTLTISPSSFSTFGTCYKTDLLQIYKFLPQRYHNQPVVYVPGDISFELKQQSLIKSRLKTEKLGTLIKVEKDRHYELKDTYLTNNTLPTIEAIKSMDCKFKNKKSSVVFRGAITPYCPRLIWFIKGLCGDAPRGKARRLDLIKKYINNPRYNIAGSICHDSNYNIPNADQYIKNHMTIKEMLTYRYVISVEGNDVASNLKWLMLSNSVVMMPTPTTVTWFMEDHLKPYVHYIPLKSNFSDLNKQFEWCERNLDQCEQIAREATLYAMKFYDHLNEGKLNRKVLKTYIDNCEVAQR